MAHVRKGPDMRVETGPLPPMRTGGLVSLQAACSWMSCSSVLRSSAVKPPITVPEHGSLRSGQTADGGAVVLAGVDGSPAPGSVRGLGPTAAAKTLRTEHVGGKAQGLP